MVYITCITTTLRIINNEYVSDKRVADWPLMSSPMYTIYLCVAYLVFVAVVPQVSGMKHRLHYNHI